VEGWSDTSGPFVDSKCAFVFKWDPSQRHLNTYRHAQVDALMRVAAASEGGGVGVGSGSNTRNCGREGAPGEMEFFFFFFTVWFYPLSKKLIG
jgi:hypothetical protein